MSRFKSAQQYHEESKYSFDQVKNLYTEFPMENPEPPFKKIDGDPIVLPKRHQPAEISFEEAMERAIGFQPQRHILGEAISLVTLSRLLYLTNGVTLFRDFPTQKIYFRAAPSASALYPTEVYFFARRVTGLPPGLFHFQPREHAAVKIGDPALEAALVDACFTQSGMQDAPLLVFLTSVRSRSRWRFRQRAYRYCLMEAGYIAQNLVLAAAEQELACNVSIDFVDSDLNKLLDLGEDEVALAVATVGLDGGAAPPQILNMGLVADEADQSSASVDLHSHSAYTRQSEGAENFSISIPPDIPNRKMQPGEILVSLPPPAPGGQTTCFSVIEKRRSAHNFTRSPLTAAELSRLLHDLQKVPLLYAWPACYTYLVINQVEKMENGIYHFIPEQLGLEQQRRGTYRGDLAYLTLAQDAVFNASVVVFFSVDFKELSRFGNRGYRLGLFNTGMLCEALYLSGSNLGIGVRGIGNFFDDSLNAFFQVQEPGEKMIGGVILGR